MSGLCMLMRRSAGKDDATRPQNQHTWFRVNAISMLPCRAGAGLRQAMIRRERRRLNGKAWSPDMSKWDSGLLCFHPSMPRGYKTLWVVPLSFSPSSSSWFQRSDMCLLCVGSISGWRDSSKQHVAHDPPRWERHYPGKPLGGIAMPLTSRVGTWSLARAIGLSCLLLFLSGSGSSSSSSSERSSSALLWMTKR